MLELTNSQKQAVLSALSKDTLAHYAQSGYSVDVYLVSLFKLQPSEELLEKVNRRHYF